MIRDWTADERNVSLPAKTNSCIIKNIDRIVQKIQSDYYCEKVPHLLLLFNTVANILPGLASCQD